MANKPKAILMRLPCANVRQKAKQPGIMQHAVYCANLKPYPPRHSLAFL